MVIVKLFRDPWKTEVFISMNRVSKFCILATAVYFAVTDSVQATDVLFANSAVDHTLTLSLTGPFKSINRNRDKSITYPGQLSYANTDDEQTQLDIDIQVRGNFRRNKKNCRNPPLRIIFDETNTRGTIFEKQTSLKLVVPCKKASRYEQYVLLEYLHYKIFNKLTDASFRSRLAMISIENNEKPSDDRVITGFFIEDNKRLGKRLNKKKHKVAQIPVVDMDPVQTVQLNLFQYMVGNTDYSMLRGPDDECCHNVKLFRGKGDKLVTPIPYDFDFTGLVNASYAEPNPGLGIRNVRTRLYRGFCTHNDLLIEQALHFLKERSAIEELIQNTQGLNLQTKKRALKYLAQFFDTLDSPRRTEKVILNRCR